MLPSAEKKELYPGDRDDVIDFSLPGHESKLLDGWYAIRRRVREQVPVDRTARVSDR